MRTRERADGFHLVQHDRARRKEQLDHRGVVDAPVHDDRRARERLDFRGSGASPEPDGACVGLCVLGQRVVGPELTESTSRINIRSVASKMVGNPFYLVEAGT